MINGGINENRRFSSVTKYLAGQSPRIPPTPDKFSGSNQTPFKPHLYPLRSAQGPRELLQRSLTHPALVEQGKEAQGGEESTGYSESSTTAPALPHSALKLRSFASCQQWLHVELPGCPKPAGCQKPPPERGDSSNCHMGGQLLTGLISSATSLCRYFDSLV